MLNFDQINREKIEQLIESGVDINSTGTCNGNDSYTFLHAAVDSCDIESIKFILSKNPKINTLMKNYGPIDDDGDGDDSDDDDDNDDDEMDGENSKVKDQGKCFRDYTPLHIAVIKNRLDIVELLLIHGANVNIEIENCHSILNTAIKTENIELISLLINFGADVNSVSVFKIEPKKQTFYFSDDPVPVKLKGFTPLHVAVDYDSLDAVKLLMSKGANLNTETKNNPFVLINAVYIESYQIVDYLLKHGAHVNCKNRCGYYIGYPPLNFAIQKNRFDLVKLLVSFGAETKDKGVAIFLAIEKQNFDMVKFLVRVGFDINDQSNEGESQTIPLNAALDRYDYELVELLLVNGGNMNGPMTPDEGIFDIIYHGTMNQFLKKHVLKVRALKKYTGDLENVDLSSSSVDIPEGWTDDEVDTSQEWMDSYESQCEEEIIKMKRQVIGTSYVSYYKFLKKNLNQLGMYAKNSSIVEELSSDKVEEIFPIYAGIIKNCFEKGLFRKQLLDQVANQLPEIFSKLSQSVVVEIFSYLKNEDIKHFLKYL